MKQLVLSLASAVSARFENFAPGRNAEAVSALSALAQGGRRDAQLYLWGAPGCGRSHLVEACAAAAVAAGRPFERFATHRPADTLVPGGLVLADDADRLDDAGQVALFNVINAARDLGGSVVATGRVPPARLALRPELATRLGWGLVYELHVLDDAEKARAMRDRAAALGLALPADVVEWLLRHTRRDLASLFALIDALDQASLEQKRPITLPLVREALQAPLELDAAETAR
jgi:DnaA family protein